MAIVYIQDPTCEGSFGFPDFQVILRYLRETIAIQAQEIAVLKATVESLQGQQSATITENLSKK
jgi:hypothetical protein